MFPRFIESLLGLLFPDHCAACAATGSLLCADCRGQLAPYTGGVARIANLDEVQIAYLYQSPVREAIHQLKYRRRRRVALPLGELLASHLRAYSGRVDAVIPIPMHAARRAERGFNQTELLATAATAIAGLTCMNAGLTRIRATEQQVHLDRRAREQNMHGAFAWQSTTHVPRRVILLDDVLTTGATMSACAHALREAGCTEVYGLALARSLPK